MDLEKFAANAARKKKSLSKFLGQLDELLPPDLQEIVDKADAKVWAETDCTSCANCCKTMTPTFSKRDITRIAAHLNMTVRAFRDQWLYKEKESGDWVNTTQPCQFLASNNMCSIYEVRPADCAEFPHHNKQPFDDYNAMYATNMMHCPATLSLVYKVKKAVQRAYEWPE